MKRLLQRPILAALVLLMAIAAPALAAHAIAHAQDCGCSPDSDYCPGTSVCHYSNTCNPSSWGCGTFGFFPCNGLCAAPPPIDRPEPK